MGGSPVVKSHLCSHGFFFMFSLLYRYYSWNVTISSWVRRRQRKEKGMVLGRGVGNENKKYGSSLVLTKTWSFVLPYPDPFWVAALHFTYSAHVPISLFHSHSCTLP